MSGLDPQWNVPSSWVWAPASELCVKIQDGTHFSPKAQFPFGKYPYVTAKNVRPDGIDVTGMTYLREEEHRAIYRRCDTKKGDVLLVKDGVNTGDTALNTYEGEISLLSSVCFLRPRPDLLLSAFLRYFLSSPTGQEYLCGRMTGTAIRRIVLHRIKETRAPLAPLPEQRRIVEAIETQLTRLDSAVATLKRVQANLKRYRASVLKAAVEGHLVPTEAELARREGREYEPASVLLERVLKERRRRWEEAELAKLEAKGRKPKNDQWRANYPRPTAPVSPDSSVLPEGWCWASVEQLAFVASGQTPGGIENRIAPLGEIPWFRVGDMNTAGNEECMHVAKDWLSRADAIALNLHVQPPGTIIFPKRGGAIRTNKKRRLTVPSTYDLNTMGLAPVLSISRYLWVWMLGLRLERLSDGSNVPQINHSDIAPLLVALPPEAEQLRINLEVDRLLTSQGELLRWTEVNLLRTNRLRQSILKWAFEGKLVDQDPNDEPASVLLERIKAEREAAGTERKKPPQPRRKSRKA